MELNHLRNRLTCPKKDARTALTGETYTHRAMEIVYTEGAHS